MSQVKQKKCRVCRGMFTPVRPMQTVCSPACAIAKVKADNAKKAKATLTAKRKETALRKEKLKTRSAWIKDAQAVFNRYIRVRDAGDKCIACCAPVTGGYHASHYIPAGRSAKLRFDEDNVHGGCARCNLFESGNLRGFRIGLIKKIGEARVIEMENDYSIKSWTIPELKELISKYKVKTKEFENDL